ncbi:Octamer-binding transcription factor [Trema orientale]|uniref:Octamer-binding transcription factor n=1 Tax=Trema orientale TaxID=63057 RepID=A0A2P5CMH7_TREOI|nr:Octamer-binding transcription factor [Trema orientale]
MNIQGGASEEEGGHNDGQRKRLLWTEEEDRNLMRSCNKYPKFQQNYGIDQFGPSSSQTTVPSPSFQRNIPGRTRMRAKEEEKILEDYVLKQGEGNWDEVQTKTGLDMDANACKITWEKIMKSRQPALLTQQDEAKIVILHLEHGNDWSCIANQLREGITSLDVKNYWDSRKKAHEIAGLPLYSDEERQQYLAKIINRKDSLLTSKLLKLGLN